MFSPGHLGPTQTPVQPKEQGLPGVSGAGGGGGGGGAGATSCLAAIHSVILGMMGPLESGKGKEHEGGLSVMIVPDTVLTLGEFPIAVSEENTLPVLRLTLEKERHIYERPSFRIFAGIGFIITFPASNAPH